MILTMVSPTIIANPKNLVFSVEPTSLLILFVMSVRRLNFSALKNNTTNCKETLNVRQD